MKNIFFALVGFALLCSASCCKPEQKECEIVPINPVMKDYVFDVGSYWVYEDDSSGIIDTIRVVEIHDSIVKAGRASMFGSKFPQFVKTDFYRSATTKTYAEGLTTTITFRTTDFNGDTDCYIDSVTFSHNCSQGIFSFASNTFANNGFAYKAFFSSYLIGSNVYYNVRQFWTKGVSYNASCSTLDLGTYYSPKVGLIKFTETETNGYIHSYSLISYNAIPFTIKTYCNE